MFSNLKSALSASSKKLETGFFFWRAESRKIQPEPALRSELLSSEQMENHGYALAKKHKISKYRKRDRILDRLNDNEYVLRDCCKRLSAVSAVSRSLQVSPAGEWLLDNFWLVEEQIHSARKNMPKAYIKRLPQLADGQSAGLPRVYDLVLENISHGDGRLDIQLLTRFIQAYQTMTPLTLGELWAIPIMLRLALIENLRRVSTRIMSTWHDQNLASKWVDRIIESAGKEGKSVVLTIAEMAESKPPMTSAFVAELARGLQGQSATFALPLTWIEEMLSEFGLSIEKLIHQDTQQQAADQVSISNTVNSLRLLSAQNWKDFVEGVSIVEHILQKDPASVYGTMDFATRDRYRHVIERLADKFNVQEEKVAMEVVNMAREHAMSDTVLQRDLCQIADTAVNTHVGYFLIDDGLPQLKTRLASNSSKVKKRDKRDVLRLQNPKSLYIYLGLILGMALLLSWPFFNLLKQSGWHGVMLGLLLIPALFVTSQLGIKLINWVTVLLVPPYFAPRLDYQGGIPDCMRTLVVIPTMLGSESDVEKLLDKLEVHYLANRDKNLQFGLLTDFKDANQEVLDSDAALLQLADEGIKSLNAQYPNPEVDTFFLCHRPRRWNESEKVWMCYERKRGKLCEFNALLRGHGHDRFILISGNTLDMPKTGNQIHPVRYVITLDTDTLLPRESAWKLVGTMGHPLNHPVYSETKNRIVAGYAIMQPRVGVTMTSANKTGYATLFSTDPGIDPYTLSVSDIYQDLFSQGSYVGKGIYDVDAFEQAINDKFPDNTILSHDLIEGCYARSGLITDVVLFEDYPAAYLADTQRHHRWVRGDWQLLPWLMPRAPLAKGKSKRNLLSILSLWKILDNLRRSLVPPALLAIFLIGWFASGHPTLWTLIILSFIFALPIFDWLFAVLHKSPDIKIQSHLEVSLNSLVEQILRSMLMLIWLPYEVFYNLDAVLRTLWRLLISKKNLLQWNPSNDASKLVPRTFFGTVRVMFVAPLASIVITVCMVLYPIVCLPAAIMLFFWLISPFAAWWLSKPKEIKVFIPTEEQKRFLYIIARKTWTFFEHYVTAERNWLPPDNMQEEPHEIVAERTSPTNIGMYLLSCLSAHDFRYISPQHLLDRLSKTLYTMLKMERYRKHFYNWYDITTLEPLHPQYISTVDSGNLAGHLLTLRQGLTNLGNMPVCDNSMFDAIADTASVLASSFKPEHAINQNWQAFKKGLITVRSKQVTDLNEAAGYLWDILNLVEELEKYSELPPGSDAEFWLKTLVAQCKDLSQYANSLTLPHGTFAPEVELQMPTLRQLADLDPLSLPEVARKRGIEVKKYAASLLDKADDLAEITNNLAYMDFTFLYDNQRDLFSIGFNISESKMDRSYYDLLASEARLPYFVAIAQGQIPQESWFTLGRMLTTKEHAAVLLSWSGSMFEYLMPNLVMPSYEGSILDITCHGAVKSQMDYGHKQNLPWGVSESGYNIMDGAYNYQYQAFGVPGLGLKRGLADDYVVAPYASALALMVDPKSACSNLEILAEGGMLGRFGMYEAVDYTHMRLPRGKDKVIIPSFMSHHQGMSLLSLNYLLSDKPMQKRFLSEPAFKATSLLLEERMPKLAPDYLQTSNYLASHASDAPALRTESRLRIFTNPNSSQPAVQLLSNGNYHVMVSSTGSGYSRYHNMAITRWQEDVTRDNGGMVCYIRDVNTGDFWSTTYQPTCKRTELYEAIFCDARAEFKVRQNDFDAHTEIVVSPEDNIELRRVRVTNRSREKRTIELTSYGEIVLSDNMADAQHPAFNKLFVQTEIANELKAIICSRRRRSVHEHTPFAFHLLTSHNINIDSVSYETDRNKFIGRGRNLKNPMVMENVGDLSNTQGPVLDPVVSIRCQLTLDAGQTAIVDLVSGVADDREGCIALINKFRDQHLADRTFDLAWTHSQMQIHQFNASINDTRLYEQMAAAIIYATPAMRAEKSILESNTHDQSRLWSQSISGDLPIVLVRISDTANIDLVAQMVKAHAYWRQKGLAADLVVWNEDDYSYRQNLHDMIMNLIPSGSDTNIMDRPGGIFVRAAQMLSREDRIQLQAVARLILNDSNGTLTEQVNRRRAKSSLPVFIQPKEQRLQTLENEQMELEQDIWRQDLILTNKYGGFNETGDEYIIILREGQNLPAPWVNVLANENFGTVVSETGSAYTWQENAHEFRLTPWLNDPVTDASGEAFYIRDEYTGYYWSPSPWPTRGKGSYTIRHGFGYTAFEHIEDGIASEVYTYTAKDAPVKFWRFRLHNRSGKTRQLSITGYIEWVLGDFKFKTAMHTATKSNGTTGAIFAHNPYSIDFSNKVAFFNLDVPERTVTGDRSEFIGRNQSLQNPAAMERLCLSGRTGPGLDPCGAIFTSLVLHEDETKELVFVLGAADNYEHAENLVKEWSNLAQASAELENVRTHWKRVLNVINIKTPDTAMNMLANGWLMYQTIGSRIMARSGFYQSGGAYGLRDQLQDCMSLVYCAPDLVRKHILRAAAHQFPEGDAMHWWHPPSGRGVRTRCSDDFLWLPTAVERYVRITGDDSILDEEVNYIEARELTADEESFYDMPMQSNLRENIYQHCVRAINRGFTRGKHGLPLMGSGDWNDGMNMVGIKGIGESVWLGFFQYQTLRSFAYIAAKKRDAKFAERCIEEANILREKLEEHGWDGSWYKRAFFDDGTPLGSQDNEECRIDSISQSWSVLSGAATEWRQHKAMKALNENLVEREIGIIRLLKPPFDKSRLEPGYIKGYVPGVRENGGQYTHAAIWAIMAFAKLGDKKTAWELLDLINPIKHALSDEGVETYKVEPYVLSADVYAEAPHAGRGGWSWLTGAAAWMYRLITEELLGFKVEGENLYINPLVPDHWQQYTISYMYKGTTYNITINQLADENCAERLLLDGEEIAGPAMPLVDDGNIHEVEWYFPIKPETDTALENIIE